MSNRFLLIHPSTGKRWREKAEEGADAAGAAVTVSITETVVVELCQYFIRP